MGGGPVLQQAQLSADQRDGGEGGGLGAEDAWAEVGEGEALCAEQVTLCARPAALGTESEHDGLEGGERAGAQAGGGFVVVEDEAFGRERDGGNDFGKGATVGDGGEVRVEGLLGADDKVAVPFAGGPEGAVAIVGIALFSGDEVERGNAERCGIAEDVAGGLRPGEPEDERDRRGRGRRGGLPGEVEREGGGGDGGEGGFAPGSVDAAAVEGVADATAEDFENVLRSRVDERQRSGGLGRSEKDEVHAGGGPAWGGVEWGASEEFGLRIDGEKITDRRR